MTIEQFNRLNDNDKRIALFEAKKITERFDQKIKFELFEIDNFFIETKTCLQHKFKRIISTFSRNEIPLIYSLQTKFA